MARALIGSASAKMAALAESQCVVLCEAPHGYGKSAAAVKFSFDEMTVAAEHRREFSATSVSQPEGADETFAPNELRTLFLCPTATLALRVYQKLHTRENPHNFTGALLMPEFLVGGHPINLANMVCLTSDFAGIFFARATPEQLESLRYIVVVNCFYACSSQLMRGAQRARGLCPNLVSVLGLCAKFNTSITSSCQKLFEILSQRSARTSHVYRPLGYELLTKHSFLHNYKHTTLRTLCSFLKATATYYDQIVVVSRSQDLAERAYVEVNDSGTQCEIAVEIRHVADPLHATARDRFGAGLVKILIACLRQSLVKFAACDARNLILFLEPAPSKPVYVHHSSIYGVKRVITLLSSPAQQKLLSSFVGRRLTQYVI